MKNNPLSVLRTIGGWRFLGYLAGAAALSGITLTILMPALLYLYEEYRPVKSIVQSFVSGSFSGATIMALLLCMIFGAYLYLFYRRENHRYTAVRIRQITAQVEEIASGRFEERVTVSDRNELGLLAGNINNIVVQAKKAMEEERQAERIKNELVTNVSHDLRTPLTSIVGYLNLINTDRYRDEVELRYYTQVLHDKAERLHGLINDLFEYTRMQNRGLTLNKETINLREMMEQLAVQFQPQLDLEAMICRVRCDVPLPNVYADGNKLVRVFENLLQNAITYGKEGKYIDVMIHGEEDRLYVEFVNYGDMIPSIDLPHLFDRFYRVEKSRSEHSGGSGLGLAIAKSIIELHDGTIEAESDTERTLFRVGLRREVS